MAGMKFRYYKCEYEIRLVRVDWKIRANYMLTLDNMRLAGETKCFRFGKNALAEALKLMKDDIDCCEGRWTSEEEKYLGVDVIRRKIEKEMRTFDYRQTEIQM